MKNSTKGWARWIGRQVAVWACVCAAVTPLRAAVAVGDVFPAWAKAGLEGEVPATAGRVVVVDFWASWCGPCKASFPALAEVQAEFAPRGVVIIGVSVDDRARDYIAFVKRHAPPFATVRDAQDRLAAAVSVPTMPSTYVIGRDGRVRAIIRGYRGAATEQTLRAALEAALEEKPLS